ncbi:Tre-2/Bub2/Cdc16 (TBC) F family protein C [Monocercomonoides exilis]|uniref:Tre-2/Bub2/Cdc16 (TBC) F family protein C n=1 Tax=Monocercomonoides exilis TaxID=2049356 RepID=UPI00355AB8E9|nr:Tre-2/Bub2/Cdc16 (TBC) F family protein C [Monocercomonoides exilis]|eukprot:MONOS_8643.1-p1 / transcript=MONOS_8643.1 / gene=MONOS_8643 / organism=Monocercomonoides_exilis_PA203 / gene_product=Tre-2/Bub2/Cdc16 (TBC) F family protein C / transcript_product=Tre-2/Bub2/Cdc16 (TBC) F family protein C / location=Mono_scaffold00331:13756-18600(-) / protein_length=1589 / sequence_SO=supercontig / SO=protein_coding / is_pseudo=false
MAAKIALFEFQTLFGETGDECGEKARDLAINTGLSDCFIRPVCWRFFLGEFEGEPGENWRRKFQESRQLFETKRQELLVDPHATPESDPLMDNPLSTAENSAWGKYFENQKVETLLLQDLQRLFPEYAYFHRKKVMDTLRIVLLVWVREHPDLNYRQGMHEILAGLYYIFTQNTFDINDLRKLDENDKTKEPDSESDEKSSKEKSAPPQVVEGSEATEELDPLSAPFVPAPEPKPVQTQEFSRAELLADLLDPKYLEHDLYTAFSLLIPHLGKWYFETKPLSGEEPNPNESGKENDGHDLIKQQKLNEILGISDLASHGDSGGGAGGAGAQPTGNVPTVVKSARRVYQILKSKDPKMFHAMEKLGVEPHYFLMKWMRLIFLREFHIDDAMRVWDAVFACISAFDPPSASLQLMDYVAVSMIISLRDKVIGADQITALKTLMHFPPNENPNLFVYDAYKLCYRTKPFPSYVSIRPANWQFDESKEGTAGQLNGSEGASESVRSDGTRPHSHRHRHHNHHGHGNRSHLRSPSAASGSAEGSVNSAGVEEGGRAKSVSSQEFGDPLTSFSTISSSSSPPSSSLSRSAKESASTPPTRSESGSGGYPSSLPALSPSSSPPSATISDNVLIGSTLLSAGPRPYNTKGGILNKRKSILPTTTVSSAQLGIQHASIADESKRTNDSKGEANRRHKKNRKGAKTGTGKKKLRHPELKPLASRAVLNITHCQSFEEAQRLALEHSVDMKLPALASLEKTVLDTADADLECASRITVLRALMNQTLAEVQEREKERKVRRLREKTKRLMEGKEDEEEEEEEEEKGKEEGKEEKDEKEKEKEDKKEKKEDEKDESKKEGENASEDQNQTNNEVKEEKTEDAEKESKAQKPIQKAPSKQKKAEQKEAEKERQHDMRWMETDISLLLKLVDSCQNQLHNIARILLGQTHHHLPSPPSFDALHSEQMKEVEWLMAREKEKEKRRAEREKRREERRRMREEKRRERKEMQIQKVRKGTRVNGEEMVDGPQMSDEASVEENTLTAALHDEQLLLKEEEEEEEKEREKEREEEEKLMTAEKEEIGKLSLADRKERERKMKVMEQLLKKKKQYEALCLTEETEYTKEHKRVKIISIVQKGAQKALGKSVVLSPPPSSSPSASSAAASTKSSPSMYSLSASSVVRTGQLPAMADEQKEGASPMTAMSNATRFTHSDGSLDEAAEISEMMTQTQRKATGPLSVMKSILNAFISGTQVNEEDSDSSSSSDEEDENEHAGAKRKGGRRSEEGKEEMDGESSEDGSENGEDDSESGSGSSSGTELSSDYSSGSSYSSSSSSSGADDSKGADGARRSAPHPPSISPFVRFDKKGKRISRAEMVIDDEEEEDDVNDGSTQNEANDSGASGNGAKGAQSGAGAKGKGDYEQSKKLSKASKKSGSDINDMSKLFTQAPKAIVLASPLELMMKAEEKESASSKSTASSGFSDVLNSSSSSLLSGPFSVSSSSSSSSGAKSSGISFGLGSEDGDEPVDSLFSPSIKKKAVKLGLFGEVLPDSPSSPTEPSSSAAPKKKYPPKQPAALAAAPSQSSITKTLFTEGQDDSSVVFDPLSM